MTRGVARRWKRASAVPRIERRCCAYTLDLAAASAEVPEPPVLSGLADLCGDLEDTVRAVREVLDAEALGVELRRSRSTPAR
jgi:hypothetical protein